MERNIETHQRVFSHLTSPQVACDRRRDQFHISLPLPCPSDYDIWVPRFTKSWCHPRVRVYHAYKVLREAKKEALRAGICMRYSLWETGPLVLHGRICPLAEMSYQWVLLRATLFICTEAACLSWELFIDAFCLSASVFYLVDFFSVLHLRWSIPQILFSNLLIPGSRIFRVKPWCFLRCWSPWASYELCVWPLQLTSEQVFRRCDFLYFLVSVAALIADYTWWGLKSHFLCSPFSHSWMVTGQEVLWFCIE